MTIVQQFLTVYTFRKSRHKFAKVCERMKNIRLERCEKHIILADLRTCHKIISLDIFSYKYWLRFSRERTFQIWVTTEPQIPPWVK